MIIDKSMWFLQIVITESITNSTPSPYSFHIGVQSLYLHNKALTFALIGMQILVCSQQNISNAYQKEDPNKFP